MTIKAHYKRFLPPVTLIVLIAATFPATARDQYETDVDYSGLAVAIERALPSTPRNKPRRLQEAWVRMSYVVTAAGRAVDPIIINSSGGIIFENEVRKVSESWLFEPTATGAELPSNIVNTRFVIRGRGNGATRRFARYTKHIMKNLHSGDIEAARKSADNAVQIGGWNLYESTILWLMLGRVAGEEQDDTGKLEMYRRGLAVSNARSLPRKARIDLLEKIFKLESKFGQFSGAMQTLATLAELRGSEEAMARLAARAEEITTILASDPIIVANASLANPCNCDTGIALWDYIPIRRTFSFANLNGNVKRFEARCELQRIGGAVETNQQWTLEADWGFCQIFVFGDDGATFDFLEHMPDRGSTHEQTAVARNYVLDRRSRSQ